MIIIHMTTKWFNAVFLALTPREQWGAAGEFNSNTIATKCFWVVGGIILTISAVWVLIATYKQRRQGSEVACNRVMKNGGKKD